MPNLPLPPGARYLRLDQIMPTGGSGQIADISPNYWMSPLQPLKQMSPSGVRVRQRATVIGENLAWTPKGNEGYGYWVLREFAESCELFRAVLDTILDRICSLPWEIRLIAKPGEKKLDLEHRQDIDPRIPALKAFFTKPDGVWPFKFWLRMLLEDSYVCDAMTIYKERDLRGRIASLRAIDGATINRCITEQGFVPQPPSVAYQQVLYGTIWCDLTTNDLTYIMRNPRTFKRYGYSVTEQCLTHLATAIRRQDFTLKYYTDGNMPEALCFLPSDLPVSRVKEIQMYIDSVLAGDLANRRRLTFLPGYGSSNNQSKPNVIFPKEPLLKDPLDEWLFQFFCYKLGTTPQAMLRMMNRATAQQSAETAEEEGDAPKAQIVADMLTEIIQTDMGFSDIEFAYKQRRETDGLKQMQIDTGYSDHAVLTINDIRKDLGKDPSDVPEADQLGIVTINGWVPLEGAAQAARVTQMTQAKTDGMPDPEPSNVPPPKGKPGAKKPPKKKVSKRIGTIIKSGALTSDSAKAKAKLQASVLKVFRGQKERAKEKAKSLAKSFHTSSPGARTLVSLSLTSSSIRKGETAAEIANAIYAALESEWNSLPAHTQPSLANAMRSGIGKGMSQLGLSDAGLIAESNTIAEDYARERSAEMVGMQYNDDGELVSNPNAEWVIADTTREKIRNVVADAFTQNTLFPEIMQDIQEALEDDDAGIFSEARAELIARTEISNAQVKGNYGVWEQSGLVHKVQWLLSDDHEGDDECDDNSETEVRIGHPFPSGVLAPPAHPNCECSIVVTALNEEIADE